MWLDTGAEARLTGPDGVPAVVLCVNGGQEAAVAGTWSASLEWLVRALAPRFPSLRFCEVRYRVKSWRHLDLCAADARAALRATRPARALVLGFSMGGAVAVSIADEPAVETVVGLAPWLPDRLDLAPLRGRRLAVVHGSLDRPVFCVPGVSPETSRRAFDRARTLAAGGRYSIVRGALHGIAVRTPGGRLVPLPRARAWADEAAAELELFAGSPGARAPHGRT